MRHWNVLAAVIAVIGLTTVPVFGETTGTHNGDEQVKNVQTGARNVSTGWTEIFDGVAAAQGQSKNTAHRFTGVIAGVGAGTKKALHKTGAGIIDLATFWIPKKEAVLPLPKKAETPAPDRIRTEPAQNFGPRLDRT